MKRGVGCERNRRGRIWFEVGFGKRGGSWRMSDGWEDEREVRWRWKIEGAMCCGPGLSRGDGSVGRKKIWDSD